MCIRDSIPPAHHRGDARPAGKAPDDGCAQQVFHLSWQRAEPIRKLFPDGPGLFQRIRLGHPAVHIQLEPFIADIAGGDEGVFRELDGGLPLFGQRLPHCLSLIHI